MVIGGNTPSNAYDLTVKLILLGDYSVGKTSLLNILSRQTHDLDFDDNGNSIAAGSVTSSLSTTSSGRGSRGASDRPPSRTAVVRSRLQPGGFVDVEFTHQQKTVLAKIADTGGR
nr:hypothetical protein BaRGS_025341 [Batillaria attramentaria]